MKKIILLLAISMALALPKLAIASVWSDSEQYVPFSSSSDSYYQVGPKVLSSLTPGDYIFSITFATLGTWDSSGSVEDSFGITAMTDSGFYRNFSSDLDGAQQYTKSLAFSLGSYPFGFITAASDASGIDEQWQFLSAEINRTSPTPIPGAAFLLGTGLLGLLGLRSKIASL